VRFVSLFAGVGGFDLGFEQAGMTCVGQVEIDSKARSVLEKHWPDVPKHDDVQTAKEWADAIGLTGNVDVVAGGFPCQDLSVAGKRAGLDGARSGLFYDALNFATHVKAKWIVLENVPGLFSSNNGRDFMAVIREMRLAGFDYVEWRVFNSQFYGVPQRRRRVYIVGHIGNPSRFPIFVERESSSGDSAQGNEAGQDVAGTVGESSTASSFTPSSHAGYREGVGTLRAHGGDLGGGSETLVTYGMSSFAGYTEGVTTLTATDYKRPEQNVVIDSQTFVKATRARHADDVESWREDVITPTLNVSDNSSDIRATVAISIVSPALSATNNPSRSPQAAEVTAQIDAMVRATSVVRRLTPLECERLQGFPDGWTAGQADSSRYKQMGNAVTVNVSHVVGEFIMVAEHG
jgi:DNA (cytosine-5)-methyltransferase 1